MRKILVLPVFAPKTGYDGRQIFRLLAAVDEGDEFVIPLSADVIHQFRQGGQKIALGGKIGQVDGRPLSCRGVVTGIDDPEVQAKEIAQMILRRGDGGGSRDELRKYAQQLQDVPQPADQVSGVAAENAGVIVDLVDDDETGLHQEAHHGLVADMKEKPGIGVALNSVLFPNQYFNIVNDFNCIFARTAILFPMDIVLKNPNDWSQADL